MAKLARLALHRRELCFRLDYVRLFEDCDVRAARLLGRNSLVAQFPVNLARGPKFSLECLKKWEPSRSATPTQATNKRYGSKTRAIL